MRSSGSWRNALLLLIGLYPTSFCYAATKLVVLRTNPRRLTNSSLRFTASINGELADGPVTWSSSNPRVATITGNSGTANAALLTAGSTTITPKHGGQEASTTLTVTVAARLVFTNQPTDTNVNAVNDGSSGGVKVQLLDNLGGPLSGQSVSMSIWNNPPGTATLTGALTPKNRLQRHGGFPGSQDWLIGSSYTLTAAANPSSGDLQAFSATFNVLGIGNSCLWAGSPKQTCGLVTPCTDTDGDGLPDAWETAGGLDLKGDGTIAGVLTNIDPVSPDGTPNPTPSADPNVKDVFVKYDRMDSFP